MTNDQGQAPGAGGPNPADQRTGAPAAGGAATSHRATNSQSSEGRAGSAGERQTGMDDLKEEAGHIADQAKERGKRILSREKNDAAGTLDSVADAFRTSAEQLDGEQQRRYLGMAADRLESLGQRLRDKDIDSLLGDAQDTARRAPVAFFAGSVITGFLLARFMKSSAERRSEVRHGSGAGDRGDRSANAPERDGANADRPSGSTAGASATRPDRVSEPAPQGFGAPITSTSASTGGSHA